MSGAPSDDVLSSAFNVDQNISRDQMLDQLGPRTQTQVISGPASGVRSRRSKEPDTNPVKPVSKAPHQPITPKRNLDTDPAPVTQKTTRKQKPEPHRENQLTKLSSTMDSIEKEEAAPIPDVDALNTSQFDALSEKSVRMEEMVEDHETKLTASTTRIAALERENSILVQRINNLSSEMSRIKETVSTSSGGERGISSQSGRESAPKTSAPKASGSGNVSSVGANVRAPVQSQQPDKPQSSVGSRPISKRKVLE